MAKKRRSREFKNSSQVIDIEEARKKRQEKRNKNRSKMLVKQEPQRPERKSIRQGKNRRVLIYAVIIFIMVAVVGASIYNIMSLKGEQKDLLQEQKQLEAQKQELEEELKHLEDPDYIEEQARAQLRLVMPGESIYVFPDADNTRKGTENEKD